MPPASSDNQGLKIAVAVFVTLTLVLAVTTYLGYSNYSESEAKLDKAVKAKNDADATARSSTEAYRELRERVGGQDLVKIENKADVASAIDSSRKKMESALLKIGEDVNKQVQEARSKGLNRKEVETLGESAQQIYKRMANEQTQTLESQIANLVDLLHIQANLTVALSLDNMDQRSTLEGVNTANEEKVKLAEAEKKKAQDDKVAADQKHEQDRVLLVKQLDQANTQNAQLSEQVTTLKAQADRQRSDYEKQIAQLRTIHRQQRTEIEKTENRLDVKDGVVNYSDLAHRTVRTSINRSMGAHPQLRFSIFDRNAPGLPTDRPKATIELTAVDTQGSTGRVLTLVDNADPIRPGDQVYSPTWDPNRPKRFALIGKIDINRDGRDDRQLLKRLIELGGGVVDYDLPPATEGKEQGQLDYRIDWYVIDEQKSPWTIKSRNDQNDMTQDRRESAEKQTKVVRAAQEMGIRPMPVERLLNYLGYSHGQLMPTDFIPGRVEARNGNVIQGLLQGTRRPNAGAAAPKAKKEDAEAESKDEADTKSKDDADAKDDSKMDDEEKKADKPEKEDPDK